MLLAGSYAGPEERQRFLRKAEAVAGLRHANIVQVNGAGDHDGRPYFTMEYVEGGSLAQTLLGTPRPALLNKFGAATDPCVAERTARAFLLLPATGDELRQAVALAGRAVAVEPSTYQGASPHFLFARGLAEYRQGRFDRAIATMRGDAARVLGPAPRLVLAMALHRSGQGAEARKTLAAAVLAHDWRADQVRNQDDWIFHVLRRDAEGMILPDLPAFLRAEYPSRDNDERVPCWGSASCRAAAAQRPASTPTRSPPPRA
jgi:hypothetical protein